MSKSKILIVEDNAIAALDIRFQLQSHSYDVPAVFLSGEDVLNQINEIKPDLVLMDINLKGEINGIKTAQTIKENYNIPVIFLTAYSEEKMENILELSEYDGFLKKPFDQQELMKTIEKALNKSSK